MIEYLKFENDVNESIYLNEIQNLKDQKILSSQKSQITVKDLLSHVSGLPAFKQYYKTDKNNNTEKT